MNIKTIFNTPKIIGVLGDVNEAKSNLLYYIITELKKEFNFNLFCYGLRLNVPGAKNIYSVVELENITDSIIIVDELSSLFDLENRKSKRLIENTLRLINHNNNILLLCGVPENFKKFISAKLNQIFFKKCTISDCINGSTTKNIINFYNGYEKGSEVLNIAKNKTLFYDGQHYHMIEVPYLKEYDTKKDNLSILERKQKEPILKKELKI
jgi:hypothetical protein